MRAMILAAGRGARLRPMTDDTPKPLLEIGDQSLIGARIRALAQAGIRDIVINLAYRGDQIRAALGDGAQYGVTIVYSEEYPDALDTGGGVRAALPLLGGASFIVVAADIWTDFDFSLLTLPAKKPELVFVPNPPHRPGGDYGVARGYVSQQASSRLTYAGIGRFTPGMFHGFEERTFGLAEVIDRSLATSELRARVHRGAWRDLGRPDDLAQARKLWTGLNA